VSFTVVPLQGLGLPTGSTIPFGTKFVLQDVPEWLKQDEGYLKDLSREERRDTLDAKQVLVAEYYANSFGYPDPECTGQQPKGIQNLRLQSAILANMSILAYTATAIPGLNMLIQAFPYIICATFWRHRPFPLPIFIALTTGPTIFLVVATEKMISSNNEFVDQTEEERWTFGQTLALFLACLTVWTGQRGIRKLRNATIKRKGVAAVGNGREVKKGNSDDQWTELVDELGRVEGPGTEGKHGDAEEAVVAVARRGQILEKLTRLHGPSRE